MPAKGDTIHITALSLHLPHGLGPSAFNLSPPPPCPALITLHSTLADEVVPSCSANDAFGGLGINYSSLSKEIIARATSQGWASGTELLVAAAEIVCGQSAVQGVDAAIRLPRASLAADAISYAARFSSDHPEGTDWSCIVENLRCRTIVGLHAYEQRARQWLELDVSVKGYEQEGWSHTKLADTIYEWLERSSYGTLEALVDQLAEYLLTGPLFSSPYDTQTVHITLRKPSALPYATPGISITRSRADYPASREASSGSAGPSTNEGKTFAYVALGSNIGDRIGHIRRAVRELEDTEGFQVVTTSRLYESEPMYVEDQDRFINGAVQIETTLPPLDVLRALKRIERSVGRTKTFRNGPRVVDLDLLVYGTTSHRVGEVDSAEGEDGVGWLEVPHPRIAEREFVLRPLADIKPDLQPYYDGRSVQSLLSALLSTTSPSLAPIIPFPRPARPLRLGGRPHIMQIFNATPDSFSDGDSGNTDPFTAYNMIKRMWDTPHAPAILDIGGMSTRPGSIPCTEEEEMGRTIPLIRLIRSSPDPRIASVPISIDTYRATVAREAIKAGASCINDVRGGDEPGMRKVMAESGVPVVIMHSRGDSMSMQQADMQDYGAEGVVSGVRRELAERVTKALDEGVKRWDVILDPGLGFAKSHEGNLQLLRGIHELSAAPRLTGLPVLVGGSRKGFVGKVIGRGKEEAKERGYGDAAVVAWCCANPSGSRVDIVRVHDGRDMAEVVAMWKAIEGA